MRAIVAIFGIKAAALLAFSYYEVSHAALTMDFGIFYQAWSQIAHGDLNPYSTMVDQPFYKDHFATAMWPLALLGVPFQSPMTLKAVQDIAAAGADLIGALWILDMLRDAAWLSRRAAAALLFAGVVSLFLNPWSFSTDAFDFHFYTFSEFFLMASLWAFYRGKAWIGIVCALAVSMGGDVNATYAIGLGASVILACRRYWKQGGFIAAVSLLAVVGMHKLGAGTGSGISSGYGYLSAANGVAGGSVIAVGRGILQHPGTVLGVLWNARLRIYSNLGPNGIIGFFSPWAIGPWTLLLLENILHSQGESRFSLPGFQFGVGYALLAPGATWVVLRLQRLVRLEAFTYAAAAILSANALGWAVVWLPQLPTTWVRAPLDLAQEVYELNRTTPDDAQIVASQGVVGGMAGRPYVRHFVGADHYRFYAPRMRVILTPYSGIEMATVEETADAIGQLLDSRTFQVVRASNLAWAFDYGSADPPQEMPLGYPRALVPAAAFASDIGERVLGNSAASSVVRVDGGNDKAGYLLKWAYFRRPPGRYTVTLTLSAASPLSIEVRDASKDLPLFATTFKADALRRVTIPITLPFSGGDDLFDGVGPFLSPAWHSSPYDEIEVRISAPAHAVALVGMVGVSGKDPTKHCVMAADRNCL